jgi:hypothetical protein
MSSKHPTPDEQPAELQDDLDRDPGIGQSNTVEGDIVNDGGDAGRVDPDLGRAH